MLKKSIAKTILLVEDEALIAMNESALLRKHEYEVIIVHNAPKAIEAVEKNSIDLILMDIDLGYGKMDGPEAAQLILKAHDLPIVFLTSHAEKEYVERVKKITGYGYVLKNAGEFVLIESINMAFSLFEANKRLKEENEERKKIEAALREEDSELTAIYEHTPVLMILVDKDRRIRKANAFAAEFVGSPAEELIGMRGGEALRCLHHLDDPRGCGYGPHCNTCKVREIVLKTFENGVTYQKTEASLPLEIHGKKRTLAFLVSTALLHVKNERLCLVAIEDITKIRENEENFKILFTITPDAVLVADAETGEIVKANNAAEDLFEISLDNLIGMNHAALYSEELRKKADVEFKKGPELLQGTLSSLEMIVETPSGVKKTVELRASALYIDNKLHLLGTFRDITERKKVDKVLARKATLLEESQVLANLGSWEWDIANDKWYFSEQWKKIHGVTDNDVNTSKLIEIAHPEDAPYIEKAFSDATELGKNYDVEHRIIRADNGEIRYIKALGEVELDHNTGRPIRMIGIAQDITELKQKEKKLQEALEEKDYLMKELNHRVKNNLSMVSSLINLKKSSLGDEVDLSDLDHQISAIRLIHEKLFQEEKGTRIDLQGYIQELLSTVFSLGSKEVKIEINAEDISMRTRTAIPIGLIVNEIATNAMKHGFTEKEERFSIDLKEDTTRNRYVLIVSNTGRPFPEDIDLNNPATLGLQLISALVEQIDGTIDLQKEPQTVFTIRFPLEEA